MVRHLKRHIESKGCPGGFYEVDIKKEIDEFKRRNSRNKSPPVVIFDYMPCLTLLIDNREEILFGGRLTECTRRAHEICQKFKMHGVELVFYLDGPIKENKIPMWAERINEKYRLQQEVIQAVKSNKEIDYTYRSEILSTYFDNFLRVVKDYGKVLISFHNECDQDIAIYASKHNTLAIFTADTDFVIMPGDWKIWSPQNFDLKTFKTTGWSKYNVRKSLRLFPQHMPILAILLGNDFMPYKMVKHIPELLPKGYVSPKIAEFVKRHFLKGCPLSDDDLNNLLDIIYDDGKQGYTREQVKKHVKISLDFYTQMDYEEPKIEPEWLKDHIEETKSTVVYIFLKSLPFTINQNYIDLSRTDVRPFSDLIIPLIRRQMGIVLYNLRDGDIQRIVYYKASHDEPVEKYFLKPIYPDKEIPDIKDILSKDYVTDEKKFEILAWMLTIGRKKIQPSVLQDIAKTTFFIPSIILYYLVRNNQISVDEADIVLITTLEAAKCQYDKMMTVKPPEKLTERPLWISFVYTHLVYHFLNAAIISGLYKYTHKSSFDGYVFHKMYPKYLGLSAEEKQKHLSPVLKYRLY